MVPVAKPVEFENPTEGMQYFLYSDGRQQFFPCRESLQKAVQQEIETFRESDNTYDDEVYHIVTGEITHRVTGAEPYVAPYVTPDKAVENKIALAVRTVSYLRLFVAMVKDAEPLVANDVQALIQQHIRSFSHGNQS